MLKINKGHLLIFFIAFSLDSMAQNNYNYLIKIINNELAEVSRLNKQIKASDDSLLLRMSELYLERGRVKKEMENERFLSIRPEKRRSVDKKSFFKGSKRDLTKANKIGVFILKKFPKTKFKGDVFYIFAFYAQEYRKMSKAEKYFRLAKKFSEAGGSSFKKASLALADINYNKKNFKGAIANYENAISDTESKWWTRDAYNLAWCYYREGFKTKATKLMKRVFKLSKKGFYLDMSRESQRDLLYFYVDKGDVKAAERFIRENGENPQELVKLARNLIDQGKGSQAIFFLQKAKKKISTVSEKIEINNMLLNLNEKFSSIQSHLKVSIDQGNYVVSKELDDSQIKNLQYHLKKMTAKIQGKVKSGRYEKQKEFLKKLSQAHLEYVRIIQIALPKKYYNYLFFQSEIDYAIGNYRKAAKGYLEVLKSKKRRISKIKVLRNLLASFSKIDPEDDFYKKNATYVYEEYISVEKQLERKKKIYPLLFRLYVKNDKLESAEKILRGYNKTFKSDMKTIEAMLANLLDYPAVKNNKKKFLSYVQLINNKTFVISKKVASAIKNTALTLQFKGVQGQSNKGKKANALRGYKLIYEDPLSSVEARKNAAYNIAILFYDLKYPTKTALWLNRSISLMKRNDVKKLFDTLRRISLDLFNQEKQKDSLGIMLKMGSKVCKDNSQFRSLATDYFNLFLVSGSKPRMSNAKFLKCIKDKRFHFDLKVNSYDYFYISKSYDYLYHKLITTLKNSNFLSEKELVMAKLLAFHYMELNSKKAKKIISLTLRKYNKKFMNYTAYKEIKAIDRIYGFRKQSNTIFRKKLIFPEKKFNSQLKKRLQGISSLTKKVIESSKQGVLLIGASYEILISAYERISDEINTFRPKGKKADYIAAFSKSMQELDKNLMRQKNELISNFSTIINNKKILTNFEYNTTALAKIKDTRSAKLDAWIILDRGKK